jgi:penicillin-binding protein 1C
MTRAVRSPGSTLKPFIYGLAFEDGFVNPESLIDDRPIRFGSYAPENFDMTFQGTVTVRKALQMSLNVPAIALLDRVGASRLAARLRQAGADLVLPKDEVPGLAMGLGGVGITLTDLVQAYAGFPRLGTTIALRELVTGDDGERDTMRLMDRPAAWQVGNVLFGTPPPDNAPHNRIGFKTGTSYGYRDAWSIGFDGRMTIGVWVGRPDGAPVAGLIGRVAAAPILFDAFARSGKLPMPLAKPPKGTLIAATAKLPLPLRRFRPVGELVRNDNDRAPHIQFPLNGSQLDVAGLGEGAAPVPVKVAGGVLPITVMVNGISAGQIDTRRQRLVESPGPGFARLTVMDATGAADTVVIRLQ